MYSRSVLPDSFHAALVKYWQPFRFYEPITSFFQFRNLFDSIKQNDVKKTDAFRSFLEEEAEKEQHVSYFDTRAVTECDIIDGFHIRVRKGYKLSICAFLFRLSMRRKTKFGSPAKEMRTD